MKHDRNTTGAPADLMKLIAEGMGIAYQCANAERDLGRAVDALDRANEDRAPQARIDDLTCDLVAAQSALYCANIRRAAYKARLGVTS